MVALAQSDILIVPPSIQDVFCQAKIDLNWLDKQIFIINMFSLVYKIIA